LPSRSPDRRRLVAAALVALTVTVAGLAGCDRSDRGDGAERAGASEEPVARTSRAGSTVLAAEAPPLTAGAAPDLTGYVVTYRIDDYAAGGHITTTDVIRVDRPFRGRLDSYAGTEPSGPLVGGQVTVFGNLSVPTVGERPSLTLPVPPDIAGNDLRPLPMLEWATERGYLDRRERRSVLGRPCTVYRAGEPVSAGLVTPLADGDEGLRNHADACFDDVGLLLEEVWVREDRVLRRKVAVDLDAGPSLGDADFPLSERVASEADGATRLREADPTSRPEGRFWVLDSPPEGFGAPRRYVVVIPDEQTEGGAAQRDPRKRIVTVADVYVRGVDVLIVDQGGSVSTAQQRPVPPAVPRVEAGALAAEGEVGILPGFRTSEVRAALPGGRFVRVVGTLSPDELVAVAGRLRPEEGGTGIRYLG
jgi:hypothetical protein